MKMEAHDLAEWSYYPEAGEVCLRGMAEREVGGRNQDGSVNGGKDGDYVGAPTTVVERRS